MEVLGAKMVLFAGIVALVLGITGSAWTSSFLKSCPIDPIAVDLGHLPEAKGFWSPEFNLDNLEKIYVGESPEDVTVDSQGIVYTGIKDGWIKRISVDGTVENHTFVGGQVLGLAVGPGDDIYAAVLDKGLVKVSKDGIVHLLTNNVDGSEIMTADGVDVAKDGTVYFTEASTKYGMENHMHDFFEMRPNGRVLKYDPSTSRTSVLVKEASFANGVALSKNEDFFLYCETSRARVMRYWLKGDKEGTAEIFLGGLPFFPDNVHLSELDGNFYIGLPVKRSKASDWAVGTPSRLLRCLLIQPSVMSRMFSPSGGTMIVVSPEGEFVKKYDDPAGKMVSDILGGKLIGDYVYFSSLRSGFISRLKM